MLLTLLFEPRTFQPVTHPRQMSLTCLKRKTSPLSSNHQPLPLFPIHHSQIMEFSPFPCLACMKDFPATPELFKVCQPCRVAKYCSICRSGTGVHVVDCFHDSMVCSKNHPSPTRKPRLNTPILIAPATPRRIPAHDNDTDETSSIPGTPPPAVQALPIYPSPHRPQPLHVHTLVPMTPAGILFPQDSNEQRLVRQGTESMRQLFSEQDAQRLRQAARVRNRADEFRQALQESQDDLAREQARRMVKKENK